MWRILLNPNRQVGWGPWFLVVFLAANSWAASHGTSQNQFASNNRPQGVVKNLQPEELKTVLPWFPAWDAAAFESRFNETLPDSMNRVMSEPKEEGQVAQDVVDLFITNEKSNVPDLVGHTLKKGEKEEEIGKIGQARDNEKEEGSRLFELEKRLFWAGRYLMNSKDPILKESEEAKAFIKEFAKKWDVREKAAEKLRKDLKQAVQNPKDSKQVENLAKSLLVEKGLNTASLKKWAQQTFENGSNAQKQFAANLLRVILPRDKSGNSVYTVNTSKGLKSFNLGKWSGKESDMPSEFMKAFSDPEFKKTGGNLVSQFVTETDKNDPDASRARLRAETEQALSRFHIAGLDLNNPLHVRKLIAWINEGRIQLRDIEEELIPKWLAALSTTPEPIAQDSTKIIQGSVR